MSLLSRIALKPWDRILCSRVAVGAISSSVNGRKFSSLPFTGTEGDLTEIQKRFRVAFTNIPGGDFRTALSNSRVILIGQEHNSEPDRRNVVRIINSFKQVSLLFASGLDERAKSIYPDIKDQSISLNSLICEINNPLDKDENQKILSILFNLLVDGINLLQAYKGVSATSAKTPLESFDNTFEGLAFLWGNKFIQNMRTFDARMMTIFDEHQNEILGALKTALKGSSNKIVFIAGSGQLTHIKGLNDSNTESIQMFQKTLKDLAPFVILTSSRPETTTYLKTSELASSILASSKNKTVSLAEVDKTVREVVSDIQNGQIRSSVELIEALNRIAALISSLK